VRRPSDASVALLPFGTESVHSIDEFILKNIVCLNKLLAPNLELFIAHAIEKRDIHDEMIEQRFEDLSVRTTTLIDEKRGPEDINSRFDPDRILDQ